MAGGPAGAAELVLGALRGPLERGERPAACLGGALRRIVSPRIHRVGAGEQLLRATALRLHRALASHRGRSIDVGLLVVEKRLVLVPRALRVIEDVLERGEAGLGEHGRGLPDALLGVEPRALRVGSDLVVELNLLLIEISLVAVADRLLAVSQSLLERGDALIGVEVLLGAVWHQCTVPLGDGRSSRMIARLGGTSTW